jgi:hypothetical protein
VGLTRADPTLTVPIGASFGSPSHQASVSGSVSGGPLLGDGLTPGGTSVNFVSAEAFASGGSPSETAEYAINPIVWEGDANQITGRLRAVQGAFGADWPMQAFAYGQIDDVTLVDGQALLGKNILLVPTDSGAIGARLSGATGGDVQAVVHAVWPDGGVLRVNLMNAVRGSFSFPVPRLPGVTFRLEASDPPVGQATAFGLGADATDIELRVPPAPVLLTPSPGAQDVGGSETITWSGEPGGVYHLRLRPTCGTGVDVITASDHVSVAQLAEEGVAPNGSTEVTWSVSRYAPLASIDEAAEAEGLTPWIGSLVSRPNVVTASHSPDATFTTGVGVACPSGSGIGGAAAE